MKWIVAIAMLVVLLGCGGSTGLSPFANVYSGTWVNLDDASDQGTSTWTIELDGRVRGQDFDPGRETTFEVSGNIDHEGNLVAISTPEEGSSASLNGRLQFDNDGKLKGILVWGVEPSLEYNYVFTPQLAQ